MKFTVTRTSQWENTEAPIEGAVPAVHHWTARDGEVHDIHTWTIEISTLEELIELSKREGQLVITCRGMFDDPQPTVEIYDDYRE